MKFRNPWIDPRVLEVKVTEAKAYLIHNGWKEIESSSPNFSAFGSPAGDVAVRVPLLEDARDYPQRVIELIADLAFAEDRWAVAVLADILQKKNAHAAGNGAESPQPTASAVS